MTIDGADEHQRIYQQLLEDVPNCQFTIVAAGDGDKGLALTQPFPPHCIILNAELPDMESAAFVAALGYNAERSQVAVVVTTSAEGEGKALAALGRGVHDFALPCWTG